MMILAMEYQVQGFNFGYLKPACRWVFWGWNLPHPLSQSLPRDFLPPPHTKGWVRLAAFSGDLGAPDSLRP